MDVIEAAGKKPLGVCHGSELVLVFGQEELLWSKEEKALSQRVRQFWGNFARYGDPNGDSKAPRVWPPFEGTFNTTLQLDTKIGVLKGLKQDACNLWDIVDTGPVL